MAKVFGESHCKRLDALVREVLTEQGIDIKNVGPDYVIRRSHNDITTIELTAFWQEKPAEPAEVKE